jgi:hypothetical protein
MMLVQDSTDVIDRIGRYQNGRTRQDRDNSQPDCQYTHHRRKCTPPGLSPVKGAILGLSVQEVRTLERLAIGKPKPYLSLAFFRRRPL